MIIEKLIIAVTQEDIDHGCIGSEGACPVARAIQKVTHARVAVRVTMNTVRFYTVNMTPFSATLPLHVSEWIMAYDRGRPPVKPFEFKLDIPQELLK